VERFDQDLDRLDPAKLAEGTARLKQRYGVFYDDYITRMLSAGSTRDTNYFANLRTVLGSKDYRELKHDVDQLFPVLDKTDAALTDAFRRLRYYYPKADVPHIISYISGFAYQVTIGEGYIGIGLDMFLGADSRFYPALRKSIPMYMSRSYTPQNIPPRVVEDYIREELLPESNDNASLLARMIYNGKVMYFMDQLLPDTPDSLKIGYTQKQEEWAQKYESAVWAYFIGEQLLYETDYSRVQKYLTPAPFTPGIGEHNESAPKLGVFTGWQIVRRYMEKHPEVTLQELLDGKNDAQKILNGSKYRP
jgi:hypothetical protein